MWWIPAALMMILIFSMSQMNGEHSSDLSGGIVEKVEEVVRVFSPSLADNMSDMPETVEFLIRKLAHAAEYAMLGGCLVLAAAFHLGKRGKALALFCILFSFLYACSDELHQLFICNRSGQPFDVGVDTFGACAGVLFVMLVLRKRLRTSQ